jgi:uncharacterized SAM-binding protein YcdF (DUF218 family)
MRKIIPWINIIILTLLGIGILLFAPICSTIGLCCLGLAFVLLCFRLLAILRRREMRIAKVLSCILSVLLCYGLVAAGFTALFIWRSATAVPQPGCDYIIVLGCGINGTTPSLSMQDRLNAAYAYLVENPNTICVVSGGQGKNETITEAACMYQELTKMGIDPSRIWLEEQATSTHENIQFSLELIEEKTGFYPHSCGIVSSEYHLFRAGMIAKKQGIDATPIPAATSRWDLKLNYFLREIPVSWYYIMTGKM